MIEKSVLLRTLHLYDIGTTNNIRNKECDCRISRVVPWNVSGALIVKSCVSY